VQARRVCVRIAVVPQHADEPILTWPGLRQRWPFPLPRALDFDELQCRAAAADSTRALAPRVALALFGQR
jgi:hypothetical protein